MALELLLLSELSLTERAAEACGLRLCGLIEDGGHLGRDGCAWLGVRCLTTAH